MQPIGMFSRILKFAIALRVRVTIAVGGRTVHATTDRGGYLVAREWFPIPAGGECETFFSPIGEPTSATLTALYAPTYW
mgnify:CR=1 FL=1